MQTAQKNELLKRAMKLCSKQEKCTFDIDKKLMQWGAEKNEREAIIRELKNQKFIDEKRYTHAFVKSKLTYQKWGPVKIRYQLKSKYIADDLIDEAIANHDDDTYDEQLGLILQKKLATLQNKETDPYKIKQKLLRYGQSKGYHYERIINITERLIKENI